MTLSLLSGRLDTIESQVVQIFQDLLTKISIETMRTNNVTQNAGLDNVEFIADNHETRIDSLEGLYSALSYSHNAHVVLWTGHTGSTTGDGIHGHTTG